MLALAVMSRLRSILLDCFFPVFPFRRAVQQNNTIKKTGFEGLGGFLRVSYDRRRVVAVSLAGPPRGRGGFLRGFFSFLAGGGWRVAVFLHGGSASGVGLACAGMGLLVLVGLPTPPNTATSIPTPPQLTPTELG